MNIKSKNILLSIVIFVSMPITVVSQANDLLITDNTPALLFDDTDDTVGIPYEWALVGDLDNFSLSSLAGSYNSILSFAYDADTVNSMIVDTEGDINLADGSVFIDRSTNDVGIGTATPFADLHLIGDTNSGTSIRMEYPAAPAEIWDLGVGPDDFFILYGTGFQTSVLSLAKNAPANSFRATATGVGIGLPNPVFDLHIKKPGATLFVQDTDNATPVGVLMELSKFGIPAFRLTNTKTTTSWDFSQRDDKRLILSLAGSGAFEFTIDESGNTVTRGNSTAVAHISSSSREVKTDFAKINPKEVMNKIKTMEVSEWRYKNTASKGRHIGPMAEDFYSLFELGPDDKHVAATDMASIALIAAKELQKKSDIVSSETASLKYETMALKMENASLKERLASLEKLVTNLASGQDLLPETGNKVVLK